jgi:hypothetical protein
MSFYMTLPSNSLLSASQYPSNTQSSFTTILNPPLALNSEYEVALTEFSSSNKYLIDFGEINCHSPFKQTTTVKISIFNGSTNLEAIEQINKLILCQFWRDSLDGFDLPHSVQMLKDFENKYSIYFPKLSLKNGVLKISAGVPNAEANFIMCKFSGLISQIIFGTSENSINLDVSIHLENNFNHVQYAAIYTDCISDQYVGDTTAPILKIINLKAFPVSDSIHVFDNPHYLPVNKNRLTSINISIRDLQGRAIKYSDIFSVSIIKLHFRIKKNE